MSGGPINFVLVEDEDGQQLNVRRAIERSGTGTPLFIASDGAEALELLRSGAVPPRRVVLLDVHMPRMDGLEFLRALRADPMLKPTVVLMLSTSNDEADRKEALSLNVAGYLLKSADFSKFVAQLRVLHDYWSMMEIP